MGDYDLTRLGPTEFEHLAQALFLRCVGGAGRIFGAGPDAGREATTTCPVTWPAAVGGGSWSGYTVMQAKFRTRPRAVADNAGWLLTQVRQELRAWTQKDPETGLPKRPVKPDNLLFITNVALSAAPGGGVDAVHAEITRLREELGKELPLAECEVWHYEHVCRLLDDAASIRAAFAGLITPGDVFTEMHRVLTGQAADLGGVLRRHAAKELLAEQWVRLGQAGSKSNERLPLGRVAVDLTAERVVNGILVPVAAAAHVLEVGNARLRAGQLPSPAQHPASASTPELTPDLALRPAPHLVLVGGPGQGKTTLGQLVCQAYRVALLEDTSRLGAQVATALPVLREHLGAVGLPVPMLRRWPLRVELNKYAAELAGNEETSLLRYLASRISDRAEQTITAAQLRDWLGAWPWLLVLDGFDEVAAPRVRQVLVDRVSDFLIEAADVDADLLVVATTRPRGYAGEFDAATYEHLRLRDLTRAEALGYATRLAEVRHADDPDVRRHVLERITEAADEEITARLMHTPLQVTIMSLLLEGRPRVPHQRHGLFQAYYETIYTREIGKNSATARLLEEHQHTVDVLHERVGLLLQVQAESDERSEPVLRKEELRALAVSRLTAEEYTTAQAADLAGQIVTAALDRLVLIVPHNDSDVGFEVRSLQEYMAARALSTGPDSEVLARMRHLAPSASWRNTWLLAAGRIAATRGHLVDPLVHLLDELDASDELTMQLTLGADLATDLLDDGFAATSPRLGRLLLRQAVQALHRPLDGATISTADALQRISDDAGPSAERAITEAARQALAGDPPAKVTAAVMLRRWANRPGPLGALGRQRVPDLLSVLGPAHHTALAHHFVGFTTTAELPALNITGSLGDHLPTAPGHLSEGDTAAWQALLGQLHATQVGIVSGPHMASEVASLVTAVPHLRSPDLQVLTDVLTRPALVELLACTVHELDSTDWAVASALTTIARQWHQYRPVGHDVLTLTAYPA